MKNRNRGEDGTLATQSVTTFIKNSKVLRGARRKGRSRRKMSQFPTREPFPFAVKTSLRNSSSCKSQSLSLSLPFFPINPCPRSNRIVRDRERGGFSRFPLSPRFFLLFEAPQEESRERRNSLFSSPSRGGGKKERKIVVISLMKIENGEGEGRVRGEYRRILSER